MLSRRRNALTLTKHCVGPQNFILGPFAQRPQNDKNSSRRLFAHGLTFGTCLGRIPASSGRLPETPRTVPELFWERLWVAQGCQKRSWAVLGASRKALGRLRWHPQGGPQRPEVLENNIFQFFVDFGLARAAFGMHFRLFRQTFRAKLQ